jgi:hypothetical protein
MHGLFAFCTSFYDPFTIFYLFRRHVVTTPKALIKVTLFHLLAQIMDLKYGRAIKLGQFFRSVPFF